MTMGKRFKRGVLLLALCGRGGNANASRLRISPKDGANKEASDATQGISARKGRGSNVHSSSGVDRRLEATDENAMPSPSSSVPGLNQNNFEWTGARFEWTDAEASAPPNNFDQINDLLGVGSAYSMPLSEPEELPAIDEVEVQATEQAYSSPANTHSWSSKSKKSKRSSPSPTPEPTTCMDYTDTNGAWVMPSDSVWNGTSFAGLTCEKLEELAGDSPEDQMTLCKFLSQGIYSGPCAIEAW